MMKLFGLNYGQKINGTLAIAQFTMAIGKFFIVLLMMVNAKLT